MYRMGSLDGKTKKLPGAARSKYGGKKETYQQIYEILLTNNDPCQISDLFCLGWIIF